MKFHGNYAVLLIPELESILDERHVSDISTAAVCSSWLNFQSLNLRTVRIWFSDQPTLPWDFGFTTSLRSPKLYRVYLSVSIVGLPGNDVPSGDFYVIKAMRVVRILRLVRVFRVAWLRPLGQSRWFSCLEEDSQMYA